ncbi:MAG TPA: DUF4326 domain-containing protein, partial [Acidothermaceae bacterium]|nr:DUF4326 domain-containing protein [Acidothermaceae bacterium]
MPSRIQLRRTKGWRKPEGAIVVARPSKWGNPFTIADCLDYGFASNESQARGVVVECFSDWLLRGELSEWWFTNGAERNAWMLVHVHDLAGYDLACWCPLDHP